MADMVFKEQQQQYRGIDKVLDQCNKVFAMGSGVVLLAMAIMSVRSIVGRRFFDAPIVGDTELVQAAMAVAVSMALPYAQWMGQHVIVDFFTAKTSTKTKAILDAVANALLALLSIIIAWRLWVGMLDLRETGDASMLLSLPTWWMYAPMAVSFALLAVTAGWMMVRPHHHITPEEWVKEEIGS